MQPKYTATFCSHHKKIKELSCGCPLYIPAGTVNLYSEKQVEKLKSEIKRLRAKVLKGEKGE